MFNNMWTRLGKITKTASGDGAVEYTQKDQWILQHFDFVQQHIMHIKGQMAGGFKAKLAQHAAAAATDVPPVATHPDVDIDVTEVDDDEPVS